LVHPGEEVHYGQRLAEVIDPFEGNIKERIKADTEGVVFYAHTDPLINEGDVVYRLIHRLHE
nr:succinylglutamate desuccinylase [Lachnospiraceae bacterium]